MKKPGHLSRKRPFSAAQLRLLMGMLTVALLTPAVTRSGYAQSLEAWIEDRNGQVLGKSSLNAQDFR
ncbi:MAG: hypothetical protein ACJ8AJ_02065 [Gemmatimonadaceae bacterium]